MFVVVEATFGADDGPFCANSPLDLSYLLYKHDPSPDYRLLSGNRHIQRSMTYPSAEQ